MFGVRVRVSRLAEHLVRVRLRVRGRLSVRGQGQGEPAG